MLKLGIIIFVFSLMHDTLAQGEVNSEAACEFRLPSTTKPESYDLLITPKLNGLDSTFCGDVKIIIVVVESTDVITLHSKDLDLIKVILSEFNGQPGKEIKVIEQNAKPDIEQINFKLEAAIVPEKKYLLTISYTGRMRNDKIGFYMSSYVEDKVTKWVAVTQFRTIFARLFLPCFDEPKFKAGFNVSIVKPKDQIVLSNMPIKEIKIGPNDVEIAYFEPTPLMSVHLLSIFVGDYVSKKSSSKVTVFTHKNSLDQTDFASTEASKLLEIMETYTCIPFSLPKLDIVAISDFDDTMENWGIYNFDESLTLINDDSTSDYKFSTILAIQSNNARNWFGNLVTCEWWDDIWLHEGFAIYFQFFTTEMIADSMPAEEWFMANVMHPALSIDTKNTQPIVSPVKTNDEIKNAFNGVVSLKAATILRTLMYLVTKNLFKLSLQDYLSSKKFSAAKPDDLFASFDKVLNEHKYNIGNNLTVSQFMKSWTDVPGYPVLVITTDEPGTTLSVSQKDYIEGKLDDIKTNQGWPIGLAFTTAASPNFKYSQPTVWLERDTKVPVPPKSGWHIFNTLSISFCRVFYNQKNYAALTEQLKRDFKVIHVINRAQIIDDAFDFATNDLLPYSVAFDLTTYLVSETSYIPFDSMLQHMRYIEMRMRRDEAIQTKLHIYLSGLTGSLFNKLEKLVSSGNTDLNVLIAWNEISVFACRFGNAEAQAKALEYFDKWQAGENILADIRQAALSVGLKQKSDPAIFKKIFDLYVNTKSPCEKDYLPWVLASSSDKTQLTQFLNHLLDNPNESTHSMYYANIFQAMCMTTIGYDALFEFMSASFTKILGHFPNAEQFIRDLFIQLSITAMTEQRIQKLSEFKDTFKMSNELKASLDLIFVSNVDMNVSWFSKFSKPIKTWLDSCIP